MRRFLAGMMVTFALAWAQTEKAQVNGSVVDPSGAVVADAELTAVHTATGGRRVVRTNAQGLYNLPFLDPGTYDIEVQKEGFRTAARKGIKFDVAQVARLDFQPPQQNLWVAGGSGRQPRL